MNSLRRLRGALLCLGVLGATTAQARDLKLQATPPASCASPRAWQMREGSVERKLVHPNAATLGNESTFYVQMSGGNLFTGLLLGPVGVLMNAQAIKSRNEGQAAAVDPAVRLDPKATLESLLAERPSVDSATAPVLVNAYVLYLLPKKSETVLRRVTLQFECDGWIGWYSYHLSSIESANLQQMTPDQLGAFAAEVREGERSILELFASDAATQPAVRENRRVLSWELNPYFKAEYPQGMRGEWQGRPVLVGQGRLGSARGLTTFMTGVHVIDASRVQIGEVW